MYRNLVLHRNQIRHSLQRKKGNLTMTREYEVQYAQKWVNFTTTVKATSEEEAIKLSYEMGIDQFTVTTGNEEINSLEETARSSSSSSPRSSLITGGIQAVFCIRHW